VIMLKLQSVAFAKIIVAHLDSGKLTAIPNMHTSVTLMLNVLWNV
jgi:hypothetical protein